MFFVPSGRRFSSSVRRVLVVGAALVAWTLLPVSSLAAVPPAFSNTPSSLPGNVPSVGFEATSTAEMGDLVGLGGSVRDSGSLPVTVVMSIWACEQGGNASCVTTPGATWTYPITLNVYAVDSSGSAPAPGTKLLSVTTSFTLPYRPSADIVHCAGSYGWYDASAGACFRGLAHPIKFALPGGTTLPNQIIWTIAFNTTNHGYQPVGPHPGASPWDSLNLGAQTFAGQPAYGTDVDPDVVFMSGDAGSLHADSGWTANAPLACIGASCAIREPGSPEPTPTPTPTQTASPTETPSPAASATAGATPTASPTAMETVAGATSFPQVTPPPTSTAADSPSDSTVGFAFVLAIGFATLAFVAGTARRRSLRAG